MRSPVIVALGTAANYTTTSAAYSAVSSGTVCTGALTAPLSGAVIITASLSLKTSSAVNFGIALATSGTVGPIIGNTVQGNLVNSTQQQPVTMVFPVTGLTGGASYNFDVLFAIGSAATLTVTALGQTSTTLTGGNVSSPVVVTVQAV